MFRIPLVLAGLLILLSPAARAVQGGGPGSETPKGLQAVGKGFAADTILLRALPESERASAIDGIAKFVVRKRFINNPSFSADNQWMADSLAALLKDMLRLKSAAKQTQIFFPITGDPGVVQINEFWGGGVIQTVTKWERTGTGWGVGSGLSPYGLTVYVRNARSIDDQSSQFSKPMQYLGGWGMEQFASKVESNTDKWYWWATGPSTWETPIVKRLYRQGTAGWQDKGDQVQGPPVTLYQAPGIIGQFYNQVNEAIGLPPLFTQSPDCSGADLAKQYPDAPTRDQCSVGSCHVFASIGPIEAGLWRAYGVKLRLSEADLFIGNKVNTGDMYKNAETAKDDKGRALDYMKLSEGGYPDDDLNYALEHGVSTNKTFPYDEMLDRYYQYRRAQGKTMESMKRDNEKEDFLTRLFYDPQNHWAQLQETESSKTLTEKVLVGKEATLDAVKKEREIVRKATQGFKVIHHRYTFLDAGVSQKQDITKLLCQGIPVTVSMNLVGLKEWGVTDTSRDAYHAFGVTGFKTSGSLAFKTRNSWGPFSGSLPTNNPDIPEEQFGRIMAVDAVLVPDEPGGKPTGSAENRKALESLK